MPDIPTRNDPPQNPGPTSVGPGSPIPEMPTGPERNVRLIGGTAIDGAPIAYIIALAAVVAALAMIPLSYVVGGSGSFPLSQAIYGLLGWILGPRQVIRPSCKFVPPACVGCSRQRGLIPRVIPRARRGR